MLGPDRALADRAFRDIVTLLPADAVIVVNDTRVLPARLRTRKPSGGAVELLFLERTEAREVRVLWRCLARSSKALRPGTRLAVLGPGPDGMAEETGDTVSVAEARAADGTVLIEIAGDGHALL